MKRMWIVFALMLWSGGLPAAPIESEWLGLLKAVVETPSGTGNVEGARKIRSRLSSVAERLGFTPREIALREGHRLIVFEVPNEKPAVLMVGHLDTVYPEKSDLQWSETKDRIQAPGIIDMKGGVVLMLHLAEKFTPAERKKVRIVLNDDEEIGSPYSAGRLRELAEGIPYGLVFEPGLPDGSLVTSHSGVYWFDVTVHGKAAHAGMNPEEGVNACLELSRKVAEIQRLELPKKNLTVNVGSIQGGTRPNVVCESATARFDVRYVEEKDLERLIKKVRGIVEQPKSPRGELREVARVSSMPPSASFKLFRLARKVADRGGVKVNGRHVGYASDANQLAPTGIQLLVGLGPYGGQMHASGEFMLKESYARRLKLSLELVREILQ